MISPAAENPMLELMRARRSLPPQGLLAPGPDAAELTSLLSLASRVPDHGKLAPWRFVVIAGEARQRAGALALACAESAGEVVDAARREMELTRFTRAPLVVAIVSRAAPHVKIPQWEQVLSAGAASMSLVIAANAMGFATAWLTEWCAYDPGFCRGLGLAETEKIAGIIYIGRPGMRVEDRVRPALGEIVSYF